MTAAPRKADYNRWRQNIARHLEDFPRQYAALEHAMAAFGDFDLKAFKAAFDTTEDIDAYNRVQAVERALGRVQNYVAELAQDASKLAQLSPPAGQHGSDAERAFAALRDARVIGRELCRRLTRAQGARAAIEHGYLGTSAGNVHRAALLIQESAHAFIGLYRDWIGPYLTDRQA
jgi:hypothetical protein